MILEAFGKGDLDAIRPHVDAHVFETFAAAVEQRKKDGLTLDNRLVAIEQAVISEANVERSVAVLTVRFEADIAAVTRNAEGQVVAGSMSDAVQTRDLWAFRRDLSSRDPNWLLIETDEDE
jgi:predicted lipid-binding transport protein (Tim44 family)